MTDFCVVSVIDLIILQIFFVMIHKPNRTINVKKKIEIICSYKAPTTAANTYVNANRKKPGGIYRGWL